jgi:hypothetical protein
MNFGAMNLVICEEQFCENVKFLWPINTYAKMHPCKSSSYYKYNVMLISKRPQGDTSGCLNIL